MFRSGVPIPCTTVRNRLQGGCPSGPGVVKSNGSEVTEELEKLCGLATERDPRFAGLHTVVISDGVKTVTGRDIERHNALDKAVGKALQAGMDLGRAAPETGGRLPGMEG